MIQKQEYVIRVKQVRKQREITVRIAGGQAGIRIRTSNIALYATYYVIATPSFLALTDIEHNNSLNSTQGER
jgi:hypothetical protein